MHVTLPRPGSRAWLAQVQEEAIDPSRPIIDAHHHIWKRPPNDFYLLEDFWVDTSTGHTIEKTVFVQCRAEYRNDGPEHLRPLGETEFIAAIAKKSRLEAGKKAVISAIISYADLTLGDAVEEVLVGHDEVSEGLFRGIRHAAAHDPNPSALAIPGQAPAGLYSRDDFRAGIRVLGRMGLTYDAWHFHHQIPEFTALARAVPETTLVLDHFGTPLGVGPYHGRQEEIFEVWSRNIAELAGCPNVFAKLGGMAMPDNGFGWEKASRPATSDEFVSAQKKYYLHTVECFGPDRCMFESNFPADKPSISYPVLWNAFKKIASSFSPCEQTAMFWGTAERVYRL